MSKINKQAEDAKQSKETSEGSPKVPQATIDNKVRMCLGFMRTSGKNKLLNAFIREDINEYEKTTGKTFNEPVDFYQLNDEFKTRYNLYLSSQNLKFTKHEKNATIACPNCKSHDVIVQYKQFLSGDEVETQVIQCNYCGGVYTNL